MEKITRERRGAKGSEGQRRRDGDGGWTVLMAARGLAGRWLEAQMCLFRCLGVVRLLFHGLVLLCVVLREVDCPMTYVGRICGGGCARALGWP